jgi:hypothetical protein
MFSEEDGLNSSFGIAIAQNELRAGRDDEVYLSLSQHPSTTNSPAMKSTPKMTFPRGNPAYWLNRFPLLIKGLSANCCREARNGSMVLGQLWLAPFVRQLTIETHL